jgi:hypothetical protein
MDQRAQRSGTVAVNWVAVASELQRDWWQNGEGLLKIFLDHQPQYNYLVQSKQ